MKKTFVKFATVTLFASLTLTSCEKKAEEAPAEEATEAVVEEMPAVVDSAAAVVDSAAAPAPAEAPAAEPAK